MRRNTFIIAASYRTAVQWCQLNGVSVFSPRTVIVTSAKRMQGWTIQPEDEIVYVHGWTDIPDRDDLVRNLALAQFSAGVR